MNFRKSILFFVIIIILSYSIGLIFEGSNSKNLIKLEDTGIENKREQNEQNKFNK